MIQRISQSDGLVVEVAHGSNHAADAEFVKRLVQFSWRLGDADKGREAGGGNACVKIALKGFCGAYAGRDHQGGVKVVDGAGSLCGVRNQHGIPVGLQAVDLADDHLEGYTWLDVEGEHGARALCPVQGLWQCWWMNGSSRSVIIDQVELADLRKGVI